VSWPVKTEIPYMYSVFLRLQPLNKIFSGPKANLSMIYGTLIFPSNL
jgi:hypothetical protein